MTTYNRNAARLVRQRRLRKKISGTAAMPRLSAFRSLRGVYAQVIDDQSGKTLASARTKDVAKNGNTIAAATEVGKIIAQKCKTLKIDRVVFDRGGYKYHGKIKALADGAREGGLDF